MSLRLTWACLSTLTCEAARPLVRGTSHAIRPSTHRLPDCTHAARPPSAETTLTAVPGHPPCHPAARPQLAPSARLSCPRGAGAISLCPRRQSALRAAVAGLCPDLGSLWPSGPPDPTWCSPARPPGRARARARQAVKAGAPQCGGGHRLGVALQLRPRERAAIRPVPSIGRWYP